MLSVLHDRSMGTRGNLWHDKNIKSVDNAPGHVIFTAVW